MTFSVVARDPGTGQLGVATTTHAHGVGVIADFTRAGVGAVATQSFVLPSYGPLGLDLMAAGTPAPEALAALRAVDDGREVRQVAFVDAAGRWDAVTGARCLPSCGSAAGEGVVALGNLLSNDDVVPATLAGFQAASGTLAERLLAALDAGEAAGGDARGRMSAALQVVSGERSEAAWQPKVVDLRVDYSRAPLVDLRRSLEVATAFDAFEETVVGAGLLTGGSPDAEVLHAALGSLEVLQHALGDDDPEPAVWRAVVLARAGRHGEAGALLGSVLAARPQLQRFVDGLSATGMLPPPP